MLFNRKVKNDEISIKSIRYPSILFLKAKDYEYSDELRAFLANFEYNLKKTLAAINPDEYNTDFYDAVIESVIKEEFRKTEKLKISHLEAIDNIEIRWNELEKILTKRLTITKEKLNNINKEINRLTGIINKYNYTDPEDYETEV